MKMARLLLVKMTSAGRATPTTVTNLRILRASVAMRGIATERSMAGLLKLLNININGVIDVNDVIDVPRCNNLRNPYWGAENIGMRRYLDAQYQDSQNIPTGRYKCCFLYHNQAYS